MDNNLLSDFVWLIGTKLMLLLRPILVFYYDPSRSSIMTQLRLLCCLCWGSNSFRVTGDEGWWRVEKSPSIPESPITQAFWAIRWRVKGILHIQFQKIENSADNKGTVLYLIIILLHCIVYVACCIAIKSFLNFSSSFNYFEHYYLFFISMTIEVIFFTPVRDKNSS